MYKFPVVAAFMEPVNLIAGGIAIALSAITLNPAPFLIGLVAEAAYLLFVPTSAWYANLRNSRLKSSADSQRSQFRARVLPTLTKTMQDRYVRLESVRYQLGQRPQQPEEAAFYKEMLSKLDYLLEKFLQFGAKDQEFRGYLTGLLWQMRGQPQPVRYANSVPVPTMLADTDINRAVNEVQAAYDKDLADLKKSLDKETDSGGKDVISKRLDVLSRRREYVEKMGATLTSVCNQLKLLEDTFGLISDEVRAQTPDQVISDINDVVTQTDVLTKTLSEVASYQRVGATAGGDAA